MAAVPRHLLSEDGRLVYELRFGDVVYGHQHTVDRGADDQGLRRLDLFTEIEPSVLGQGGSTIALRGSLQADAALAPVLYRTESGAGALELRFEASAVRATLPDGGSASIAHHGAIDALLENNVIGHLARLLAALPLSADGTHRWTVLLVNQLAVVPYAVTRAPELDRDGARGYRSVFNEHLWIDVEGGLVEWSIPMQGVSARVLRAPPPLPAWHAERPPGPRDPITYEPPAGARFTLEDVVIEGPVTPIGASVTRPPGEGPRSAVLFLSGSGRHDRHGVTGEIDIGSHEIMDHLAERGFVGLRFDSRGAGTTKLGPDTLDLGLQDLLRDAEACLRHLRALPEVCGASAWLVGHSQGGTLALMLAGAHPDAIAGVALLAAPGRGIDEVIVDQIRREGARVGLRDEQIEEQVAELREYVKLARGAEPWTDDRVPPRFLAGARSRRWMADYLALTPDVLFPKVRVPLLICQGGKDIQVSPRDDFERLVTTARATGLAVEARLYPDLDHLFKPVRGEPSVRDYFDRSRSVDPTFLEDLAHWLQGRAELDSRGS